MIVTDLPALWLSLCCLSVCGCLFMWLQQRINIRLASLIFSCLSKGRISRVEGDLF